MKGNVTAPVMAPVPPPQISFASELARKATHMFALVIPGGYYLLSLEKSTMLMIMVPIAVIMVFIDVSRLHNGALWHKVLRRIFGRMIRAHEQAGDFTGATYILASTVATVALFSKPVAVTALVFIIVGDTFAALIGRRFGKHKFLKNKSIEGSLACLATTAIVGLLAPGITPVVGLVGALVATIAEAAPIRVDDNVSVPLLSGLAMTLLL